MIARRTASSTEKAAESQVEMLRCYLATVTRHLSTQAPKS